MLRLYAPARRTPATQTGYSIYQGVQKTNLRPVLHEISKANRQISQIIPPENERLFTKKDLEHAVMALFDALRKTNNVR